MQDYFKSFLVVEWPHFRKPELLTFNFCQRWPYKLVCVKGNHTGYAASVIHEHGPKTVRNCVSIASCRRLKP